VTITADPFTTGAVSASLDSDRASVSFIINIDYTASAADSSTHTNDYSKQLGGDTKGTVKTTLDCNPSQSLLRYFGRNSIWTDIDQFARATFLDVSFSHNRSTMGSYTSFCGIPTDGGYVAYTPPLSSCRGNHDVLRWLPVSLQQMVRFGQNPSQGTLLKASQFLSEELPIRLSHRIAELEALPDGLNKMPSIEKVKEWYAQSFEVSLASVIFPGVDGS
jgi:hypothetical protein